MRLVALAAIGLATAACKPTSEDRDAPVCDDLVAALDRLAYCAPNPQPELFDQITTLRAELTGVRDELAAAHDKPGLDKLVKSTNARCETMKTKLVGMARSLAIPDCLK